MDPWPEPVERVASVLRDRGVDARLEEFEQGTTTASDAARAVGCDVAQIVKSIVFVCDGRPLLALVPGDRRADATKVAVAAGAGYARMAKREEVVAATGVEPGAVPPFPVLVDRVLIEQELLRHSVVWAGAGSARHIVGLAPVDLVGLTRAETADLVEA
jgi:prolyl-tRNA editing enzyme YbaK/EbsC (Cys-tRNA(Pro) deacylase)